MDHIIDVPHVQILDALVPQMVDNVTDAFRLLDRPIAEQVIAVRKISCSSCPSRAVPREPQRFSPRTEQIVHTQAGRGVSGGLQGFRPRHGTWKRTAEQIADTPVPGGLRHDFLPDPHPSALPADLIEEPNQGFFRTFLRCKKSATTAARSRSRVPAHSSSSTPAAYEEPSFSHDDHFYQEGVDEAGHGPVEATVHRYCCGPGVEVPQIQFLRRWVPVLRHGGWSPAAG